MQIMRYLNMTGSKVPHLLVSAIGVIRRAFEHMDGCVRTGGAGGAAGAVPVVRVRQPALAPGAGLQPLPPGA